MLGYAMVRSSESGAREAIRVPLRPSGKHGGMRSTRVLLGAICLLFALPAAAPARPHHGHDHAQPLVIGHRGASGYRPEHTLASYELAARHGRRLHRARPGLDQGRRAGRPPRERDRDDDRRRRPPRVRPPPDHQDGRRRRLDGWFTEDFTLAELKTLRAKERCPQVPPGEHALRRPLPDADAPGGARPARAAVERAAPRDRRLPRDQAPDLLPLVGLSLEEPLVRGAAPQRAGPPRRAGLRAVLRDREPAGAGPAWSRCRWCSSSPHGAPTTASPPATRAPTPTSRPGGPAGDRRGTPTGSGPKRTRSSPGRRRQLAGRRRPSSPTPTRPGCGAPVDLPRTRTASCRRSCAGDRPRHYGDAIEE